LGIKLTFWLSAFLSTTTCVVSTWVMRAHFRHLRFKSFPMIKKTLQSNEFWPLKSLSNHLKVQKGSNSQSESLFESLFESVWVHSLTLSYTPMSMDVTLELHFRLAPFHALALIVSPRLRSWHKYTKNKIVKSLQMRKKSELKTIP
jgi:hypothetical protein